MNCGVGLIVDVCCMGCCNQEQWDPELIKDIAENYVPAPIAVWLKGLLQTNEQLKKEHELRERQAMDALRAQNESVSPEKSGNN